MATTAEVESGITAAQLLQDKFDSLVNELADEKHALNTQIKNISAGIAGLGKQVSEQEKLLAKEQKAYDDLIRLRPEIAQKNKGEYNRLVFESDGALEDYHTTLAGLRVQLNAAKKRLERKQAELGAVWTPSNPKFSELQRVEGMLEAAKQNAANEESWKGELQAVEIASDADEQSQTGIPNVISFPAKKGEAEKSPVPEHAIRSIEQIGKKAEKIEKLRDKAISWLKQAARSLTKEAAACVAGALVLTMASVAVWGSLTFQRAQKPSPSKQAAQFIVVEKQSFLNSSAFSEKPAVQQATAPAAHSYAVPDGKGIWSIAAQMAKERFPEFRHLNKKERRRVVDAIKRDIIKNPSAYGIGKEDMVSNSKCGPWLKKGATARADAAMVESAVKAGVSSQILKDKLGLDKSAPSAKDMAKSASASYGHKSLKGIAARTKAMVS